MQRRLILTLIVVTLVLGENAESTLWEAQPRRRVRGPRCPFELESMQPPREAVILTLEPGWRPPPLRLQDVLLVDTRRGPDAVVRAERLLGPA